MNDNTIIIPRSKSFSEWYESIVINAKLATHANVKGCINYLPYGWSIWENIMQTIDKIFKKKAVCNVQLPIFIRESDFSLEKAHVSGFAPETIAIKNEEKIILRPTSEVSFSLLFKDIVTSYKQLPLIYNQWCSVYRNEKNTKAFLRGAEFHWQELHGIFPDANSAKKYAISISNIYTKFIKDYLLLPTLTGKKTEGEKFAGADFTLTREIWAQDGQAIQTGTSHYLGTNFAKIYDVNFRDANNQLAPTHYVTAGITTRLIGAMIVTHADDYGLVMPLKIAPIQIAILTLFADKNNDVLLTCKDIKKRVGKYRNIIDCESESIGHKIMNYEIKGVPILIIVGPNDLLKKSCTIYRRDLREKITCELINLNTKLSSLMKEYEKNLFNRANNHLQNSIVTVYNIDDFKQAISNKKIVLAPWGGSIDDEKQLKINTSGVTPRCVFKMIDKGNEKCFFTNKKATQWVYFARAY